MKKLQNKGKRISPFYFLKMNLLRQPVKNTVFFFLMLSLSLSFLVCMGIILKNLDAAHGKIYNASGFLNDDDTRILIRHYDGSPITEEDYSKLENIKYVAQAERYGEISDVNYYCGYGKDYEYFYRTKENMGVSDYREIKYLDDSSFMKSAACISDDNLIAGSVPKGLYEIAVTSNDKSLVGTTVKVVCCDRKNWLGNTFVQEEMTITGIVRAGTKKEYGQIYFSEAFCKMLLANKEILTAEKTGGQTSADVSGNRRYKSALITGFDMESGNKNPTRGICSPGIPESLASHFEELGRKETNVSIGWINEQIKIIREVMERSNEQESTMQSSTASLLSQWNELELSLLNQRISLEYGYGSLLSSNVMLIIDENLEGNQVTLPTDFYDQYVVNSIDDGKRWQSAIPYTVYYSFWNEEKQLKEYHEMEVWHEEAEDGALGINETDSGKYTMNVSREFFEKIFPKTECYLAAVYIKDYAYTDRVLDELTELGFNAISVYRVGATNYDSDTIYERLNLMWIATVTLFALLVLGILLLALVMRTKYKDDKILHLLGMRYSEIKKINMFYFFFMSVLAGAIAALLFNILPLAGVQKIEEIRKYFGWTHYLIFAGILVLFTLFLSRRHMRLWRKYDRKG